MRPQFRRRDRHEQDIGQGVRLNRATDGAGHPLHIVDLILPLPGVAQAWLLLDVGDDLVGRTGVVASSRCIFAEEVTGMLSLQIIVIAPLQVPDLANLRRPAPV